VIHLTPHRLDAWLVGTLPRTEQTALLDHISGSCEQCDRLLDGIVLDDLARLVEASEAGTPALSPADVDAMFQGIQTSRRKAGWRLPAGIAAVAMAASAALVVGTRPPVTPTLQWDGIKGTSAGAPEIAVRAVSAVDRDGELKLTGRVQDGDSAPPDTTVPLELDTTGPGVRYLFVVEGDGDVVTLWPTAGAVARVESAGRRRVERAGQWLGYGLDDVGDSVTFVAAVSPGPLDLTREVIAPWLADKEADGVRFDRLTVDVAR
jgi:hypothetical protein